MMRSTIRHDATSRTIVAYLATHQEALKCSRICAYLELMHGISEECARVALSNLAAIGQIVRVQRGWYRRRWEVLV